MQIRLMPFLIRNVRRVVGWLLEYHAEIVLQWQLYFHCFEWDFFVCPFD